MFITKLQKEVHILKHLASKATTPELLQFKFSDKQRTTAQWMSYISLIGSACAKDIINDDASDFETFTDRYESFDPTTFADTLDANVAQVIAILESASDEKLTEQKTLRGTTDTRAGHIMSIHGLYIAYKTQIFLQLKAAGLTNLGTMNLWAGMDAPTNIE